MSELIVRTRDNKPNIIGITEVKPKANRYKPSTAEYSIPEVGNYKMFEKNIKSDEGRGLLMYVDSNLEATEITMKTEFQENLFIKVKLNQNDKLLVGLIYRTPSNSSKEYNDKLVPYVMKTTVALKWHTILQHLWPDHCVINTPSANFSHNLIHEPSDLVVRKGYNCKVDSYSAFYDNGGFRHTELHDKLQEDGIDALIITGLARDYCVYYTAMDSKKLGYETYVVLDATRPVTKETGDSAVADMKIKGIQIIESPDVAGVIAQLTSDAKYLKSSILMISIILCLFKCLIGM
ncbi:pncA [Mytilus edulis]|uniref:nicotinamidase n=1 Tax=Mytilus edulis TaxID=6550 RepID=A0A8S3RCW1_MYTED|nr:pncA [Mytilus edulis]